MHLEKTGNLTGESQAFPWEGGASRSELNEMIACGNHTLKRDGAERSEADEVETSSYTPTPVLSLRPQPHPACGPPSPPRGRLGISAFRVYVQLLIHINS